MGTTAGPRIVEVTQYGQSIVSLRYLRRVWNTTVLLCARLWDTDTGREEEDTPHTDLFLQTKKCLPQLIVDR